jgi:hypothetical protein
MLPVLWILGGLATVGLLRHRATQAAGKTPSELMTQATLSKPPSAPGQLTPARIAVHGDLMKRCNNPKKLQQAAALFGHEALPFHANALLQKASLIHEMMHGARDIVERSRAGDQHAMAIAKGIGDQARAGNERAKLSWFLIEDYTKRHPAGSKPEDDYIQTLEKAS